MAAVINAFSEKEAREKIMAIVPDPMIRKIGLEMMADSIGYSNSLGRDIWAITNTGNYSDSLWLQVGHYAVFMLTERKIWLSLDKQLVETPIMDDIGFTSANNWGWQPQIGGLDRYKDRFKPGNPFSINGYYQPVSEQLHDKVYPELKRLHFEFLYKVVHIGQSIHKETQLLHLPGVLMYLRNELHRHIPDPFYQ
jgi:hypothetical protein